MFLSQFYPFNPLGRTDYVLFQALSLIGVGFETIIRYSFFIVCFLLISLLLGFLPSNLMLFIGFYSQSVQ